MPRRARRPALPKTSGRHQRHDLEGRRVASPCLSFFLSIPFFPSLRVDGKKIHQFKTTLK
jgi:hypothetical protein